MLSIPFKYDDDAQLLIRLPEFFSRIEEFKALMLAEEIQFRRLYDYCARTLSDFFIQSCSPARLTLWENALGIETDGTETDLYRRFRILAFMLRDIPYTTPKLKELLNATLGVGAWSLIIDNSTFTINVIANSHAPPDAVKIIGSLFIDVVPAHYDTSIDVETSQLELYRGLFGFTAGIEDLGNPPVPHLQSDTEIYRGDYLNSVLGTFDLGAPVNPSSLVVFTGLILQVYGTIDLGVI